MYLVEKTGEESGQTERSNDTDCHPGPGKKQALPNYHPQHVAALRP